MSEEVIRSFLPMIDSADISAVNDSLELEWGADRNKSIHLLQESIKKCVKKSPVPAKESNSKSFVKHRKQFFLLLSVIVHFHGRD